MPPEDFRLDFASVDRLYRTLHGAENKYGILRPFYGQRLLKDILIDLLELLSPLLFKKVYQVAATALNEDPYKEDPRMLTRTEGRSPDTCFTALRETVCVFYGSRLNYFSGSELAWRLAARAKRMVAGLPLSRSFELCEPHWVGLKIEDCHHSKPSKEGKPMLALTMRIYDGRFAGMSFRQRMPYRFVIAKLARDIGFQVFRKVHKNELVGCHFGGLLDTTEREYPRITEFYAPMSVANFNRASRKDRAEACLKGHLWLCHQCTLGHLVCDDQEKNSHMYCRRGTHSRTFVKKDCPRCHKEEWFDPASPGVVCMGCRNHSAVSSILSSACT